MIALPSYVWRDAIGFSDFVAVLVDYFYSNNALNGTDRPRDPASIDLPKGPLAYKRYWRAYMDAVFE